MTELSLFRVYEPHELGDDGYPIVWHKGLVHTEDGPFVLPPDFLERSDQVGIGVKHLVRQEAGHRCVRCGHRFVVGESGVLEGPHAEAKAWAAELGMNVEDVDRALDLFAGAFDDPIVDLDEAQLAKAKRTNWSPCDERCTHDTGLDIKGRPLARWRNRLGEWTTVPLNIDADAEQQASWRILTVHHLNGRKHDLRWWNLISVCQRCHLWLQRRVIMERVYPFEHDEYFKPHAAGWYAYAYRGENLTRAQTEARMDELLALERVV